MLRRYEKKRWPQKNEITMWYVLGAFQFYGQEGNWLERDFIRLYKKRELEVFQIPTFSWFTGADEITRLVKKLMIQQFDFEEYKVLYDIADITYPKKFHMEMTPYRKKELIGNVFFWEKNWRNYIRTFRSYKRMYISYKQYEPLFNDLNRWGYSIHGVPYQSKWTPSLLLLTVTSEEHGEETLFLSEDEWQTEYTVQGNDGRYLGRWLYPDPSGDIKGRKDFIMTRQHCRELEQRANHETAPKQVIEP